MPAGGRVSTRGGAIVGIGTSIKRWAAAVGGTAEERRVDARGNAGARGVAARAVVAHQAGRAGESLAHAHALVLVNA